MFLISGNSSTAYSMLDRTTIRNDEKFTKIPGGCVDEQKSLCQLLDCSVLYYYAVAHKYVVMVSYDASFPKFQKSNFLLPDC